MMGNDEIEKMETVLEKIAQIQEILRKAKTLFF